MDVTERFARNLTEQRNKRGLSPEDLGRLASISPSLLEDLEAGRTQPEMEAVIKLAGSLEVSIAALVDGLTWDPVDGFDVNDSG